MADLRGELQGIYDRHGKLTPELVLTEAKRRSHPLHSYFEWDNRLAAERWRMEQAHELIRSVRIVYREGTETEPDHSVRAWHAVRSGDDQRRKYVYEPADKVAKDEFLRRLILNDMQRDWLTLRRRYEDFEEFWRLIAGEVDGSAGQGEERLG